MSTRTRMETGSLCTRIVLLRRKSLFPVRIKVAGWSDPGAAKARIWSGGILSLPECEAHCSGGQSGKMRDNRLLFALASVVNRDDRRPETLS